MGFLCQEPSHQAAFYPSYRRGIKGRRRGLCGFHDQAGPGAPTGSRPRGGTVGMVRAQTQAWHRVTATALENGREIAKRGCGSPGGHVMSRGR